MRAEPEPASAAVDEPAALTETEIIHHVLNRFSFGPAPGQVEEIRQVGVSAWFEGQLAGAQEEIPQLAEKLKSLQSIHLKSREIVQLYQAEGPDRRNREIPVQELRDAVLLRAVYGANRILETASDFFRNHLNVDVSKDSVRYLAAEYEREVIRANALGSFGEMLMQSAKHPAMLVYLDNALSRRPKTEQELREIERRVRRQTGSKDRALESVEIARQRGLNENYARELLELHTLGVDNEYTQKDILEVARALTGWTVQNDPELPLTFQFRADMHCPGDKRVLRGDIQEDRDDPVREGERVIERILKHPGTARFLSFKLCRYLVADEPPEKMVERVAGVFRDAKGDLKAVYRAILADPEFLAPGRYLGKFKRPFEFVVSALRVTGAIVLETRPIHAVLGQLSEPIYQCEDPTGYYDQAEAWNDPGVMAQRWRFAFDLVEGRLKGVEIPKSFYDGLHEPVPHAWKNQLARRVLSVRMSKRTSDVIDAMVRDELEGSGRARKDRLAPRILGMLLGSPEFQRQ